MFFGDRGDCASSRLDHGLKTPSRKALLVADLIRACPTEKNCFVCSIKSYYPILFKVWCLELSVWCLDLFSGVLKLSSGCLELSFGCLELPFESQELSDGCLDLSFVCLELSDGRLDLSFGCLELSFGCLDFSFGCCSPRAGLPTTVNGA